MLGSPVRMTSCRRRPRRSPNNVSLLAVSQDFDLHYGYYTDSHVLAATDERPNRNSAAEFSGSGSRFNRTDTNTAARPASGPVCSSEDHRTGDHPGAGTRLCDTKQPHPTGQSDADPAEQGAGDHGEPS